MKTYKIVCHFRNEMQQEREIYLAKCPFSEWTDVFDLIKRYILNVTGRIGWVFQKHIHPK
eukprot:m.25738 g.25738  ORF g.25738 m.25738 type:complete len:60 (+) comp28937_c0_seq1:371-550(+)